MSSSGAGRPRRYVIRDEVVVTMRVPARLRGKWPALWESECREFTKNLAGHIRAVIPGTRVSVRDGGIDVLFVDELMIR